MDFAAFFWNIIGPLMQEISYITDVDKYVDELNDVMEDLEARRSDVQTKIEYSKRRGMNCTNEAQRWLDKIGAQEEVVAKIKQDIDRSGPLPLERCLFTFPSIVSRRAVKAQTEVKQLIAEHVSLNIVQTLPPKSIKKRSVPYTAGTEMESNLEKVRSYLNDDNIGIVGIYGTGGVGKTTLLNILNNSMLGDGNLGFDFVSYVEASQNLNLEKVLNDIAKSLGLPSSTKESIYDFLEDKNFLLLIDNLWERFDLSGDFGVPHPHDVKSQSSLIQKVVFTTRSEGVCAHMEADKTIRVEYLVREAAWSLFKQKAGEENINRDPRIEPIARDVANECGGLPLALTVIGRAMSTKKTLKQWEYACTSLKKSQAYVITGEKDNILSILKYSYDSLPNPRFQNCFLMCAIFPDDLYIDNKELIEYWMGHGLIDLSDDISQVSYDGQHIIDILKEACLIDPLGDEIMETRLTMHDMIRDLALWIASDYGKQTNKWIVEAGDRPQEVSETAAEKWSGAETVSFIMSKMKLLPRKLPPCPKLSTFIFSQRAGLENSEKLLQIPPKFFQHMPSITYLELSHCPIESLPSDIGCLVALRYLNLSFTEIISLPDELGGLKELSYLILRYVGFDFEMPAGLLGRLVQLRMLNVFPYGKIDPEELKSLKGVVKAVGMRFMSLESFQQLSHLPIYEASVSESEASTFSFIQSVSRTIKLQIEDFHLAEWECLEEVVMDDSGITTREECHFPKLEGLVLLNLCELKEIVWKKGVLPSTCFPCLRELNIRHCGKLRSLTWIGQLPCLVGLVLYDCEEMEQVIGDKKDGDCSSWEVSMELKTDKSKLAGSSGCAFPSLETMTLEELPELRQVCEQVLSFPSLKRFEVSKCPKLKNLPFTVQTAVANNMVVEGTKEWWDGLELEDDDSRQALFPCFRELELEESSDGLELEDEDTRQALFPYFRELKLKDDDTRQALLPCFREVESEESSDGLELEDEDTPGKLSSHASES